MNAVQHTPNTSSPMRCATKKPGTRSATNSRTALLSALILLLAACAPAGVTADNTKNPTASTSASNPASTTPNTTIPNTTTPAEPSVTSPAGVTPAEGAGTASTQLMPPNTHPLDQPESLWVITNKQRPLPQTFEPADLTEPAGVPNPAHHQLRAQAATALSALAADATNNGLPLSVVSGYRSFATQQQLYSAYVARDGQTLADTYSARPGHSEHQTGWAVDLTGDGTCTLDTCFADTATGAWLAQNAARFGFVIRYPDGQDSVTGFMFEPWHLRFVGVELAETIPSGMPLETFFALPSAPAY